MLVENLSAASSVATNAQDWKSWRCMKEPTLVINHSAPHSVSHTVWQQILQIFTKDERTHNGDKPFSCFQCDKSSTSSGLKKHEITRTGDKPFSCPICDNKCRQSSQLKTHKTTHTGDKLFSCPQWGYKCSTSGELKRHLRAHIGNKQYSCSSVTRQLVKVKVKA